MLSFGTQRDDAKPGAGWRKLAVLLLGVAAIGLPINDLAGYAVLLILAVIIFNGEVSASWRAWLAAATIVAVAIAGQMLLAPPRIDEGHNVFLPGGPTKALERGLPPQVYRHLANEFDKQYPAAKRCSTNVAGCWLVGGFPDRAFAFSADGIFHKSGLSRSVTTIDFTDPVWLGLGFTNESRYNWYASGDMQRGDRDRRFWMGLKRWHLTMPWFEMIRLPQAFVGGEMCWRGEVMWEGAGEQFSLWPGEGCRTIEAADTGRRVVGIAIKPDTLAMRLTPPWPVWWLQLASGALALAAAGGLVLALVRFRARRLILPFILIGLSIAVIVIDDASFLGGMRPFDGGDDGLTYDGFARVILQRLLAGDLWGFLQGGENVFSGSAGMVFFHAFEHVIFGESYLGYCSLILLFPFLVHRLFLRFLPHDWALTFVLLFVAVPIGILFGSSFLQYSKWAARGFADPATYILFIAGMIPIIGPTAAGPSLRFTPAVCGALLLALAIFMKPVVAPAAAVLLSGAGIVSLYRKEWARLAGLCIGCVPVFSMALHNWVYGHVFVLFSSNAQLPVVLTMPPSAYGALARELLTVNFSGGYGVRFLMQITNWLSGPAESYFTAPLNAAGAAIVVWVVLRGCAFDPWLRLVGAATLAQHSVAFFYTGAFARYHFLTWLLTILIVVVWAHDVGMGWFERRYPLVSGRIRANPWPRRLASGLSRLQKVSS